MAVNAPDPWMVLVVDKVITTLVVLVGGWLLNRRLESFKAAQSRSLEGFKSKQVREAELRRSADERSREWSREARAAISDLATAIAACNQEIAWLTWRAQKHPTTMVQTRVDEYDSAMKISLTEMFRARVRVAALYEEAHSSMKPCIDEVYRLDMAIADAAATLKGDPGASVGRIAVLYPQVDVLYDSLLSVVGNELKKLAIRRSVDAV